MICWHRMSLLYWLRVASIVQSLRKFISGQAVQKGSVFKHRCIVAKKSDLNFISQFVYDMRTEGI